MKCEICHQREASVAYTHIVDDVKKTLFVCSACMPQPQGAPAAAKAGAPVLVKKAKIKLTHQERAEVAGGGHCPQCGMTYEQFKKGGRLGCPRCYEAFAAQMQRLLKRIHGAARHCGKGRMEQRETRPPALVLAQLRQDLQQAVAREDFERAAQLRDEIRALEALAEPGERRR